MAVNNNINPYQVGAVTIDNRPYLQFMQQQIAQRQAKEATLDNYYRDLGKNVTPAGMRSQDVEGLTKKTNEWRDYYAKNRDAIVNPKIDNGKAYTEYMGRYQDQLAHINTSKNELKIDEEFGKIKLDPNKSFILDDPTIIDKFQKHTLPLGDPNRQSLNLAEISTPPKPWDIKDREAYSKYLTTGLTFDELPGKTQNLPGFKTRTPIVKQYSDENLRVIGQRAMGAYDSDRALQFQTNKLTKEVMNDPALHNQLNSVYKRVYGKDAETPKELLAAQAIMDENRKSTEFKDGTDEWGRDNAMRLLKKADDKELIKYKKDIDPNDTEMNNVWYERHYDNLIQQAKDNPAPDKRHHVYTTKGKSLYYYNLISPDSYTMEAFKIGNKYPDRIGVTDDNKLVPIFFKYDDKGNKLTTTGKEGAPSVVDDDYSRPYTRDQALVSMGYRGATKKQLREDQQKIQAGSKKAAPSNKPKTVVQNGHTYTLNANGEYE
jgi:hypothetical protein